MQASTLLVVLLLAIAAIAIVARRFALPYPIAFVLGGTALAFVPGLPPLRLDPDYVFLVILPPLLFSGGWATDLVLFRQSLRPILMLAVVLVVMTTVAVAVAAHLFGPAIPWAAAFALGAIVSPPDAIAAGAVFERFPVPRKLFAILDGEGLVNDATALVLYQFAVAAAVSGTFDPVRAGGALIAVGAGGFAVGIVAGLALVHLGRFLVRKDLGDARITTIFSLLAPYVTYLAAQQLGVSAVLATVVAGAVGGRFSSSVFDPEGRLIGSAVWDLLIFLLNALVFIAIGLELRGLVTDPSFSVRTLWFGVGVSIVVIVVRLAFAWPSSYLSRAFLSRFFHISEGPTESRYLFVIAWSGMRGIVSLAAALALPLRDAHGAPFPYRDTIVFVTFCVIFATLVFQGLTLIPILRLLHIDRGEDVEAQERDIRVAALHAGVGRLRALEPSFTTTTEWEVERRLLAEYEYRIGHLQGHVTTAGGVALTAVDFDRTLQEEALGAERREIARLRDAGEIPDEVYRTIEYDLDLASQRLI